MIDRDKRNKTLNEVKSQSKTFIGMIRVFKVM